MKTQEFIDFVQQEVKNIGHLYQSELENQCYQPERKSKLSLSKYDSKITKTIGFTDKIKLFHSVTVPWAKKPEMQQTGVVAKFRITFPQMGITEEENHHDGGLEILMFKRKDLNESPKANLTLMNFMGHFTPIMWFEGISDIKLNTYTELNFEYKNNIWQPKNFKGSNPYEAAQNNINILLDKVIPKPEIAQQRFADLCNNKFNYDI